MPRTSRLPLAKPEIEKAAASISAGVGAGGGSPWGGMMKGRGEVMSP